MKPRDVSDDEFLVDNDASSEDFDSEDEWGGIEQPLDNDSADEESGDDTRPNEQQSPPRPVTTPSTSAYVPPHLRHAQGGQDESLVKLTRQLKGQLNRYILLLECLAVY